MKTRRAGFDVSINGAVVSTEMSKYITSLSYSDPAGGEADSIDLAIHDRDRMWVNALPQEGDIIQVSIKTENWEREGEHQMLPCGSFVIDAPKFSGWPLCGTICGVSHPADTAFRETKRSKVWENVTPQEIAKEIAGRAGISLSWDVDESFTIQYIEQNEQTDSDFLMKLCEQYGYQMKVYSQKLVIYDREAYKAKPAADIIYESDILSFDWDRRTDGTYTGGEFTYTDPMTEEEIKVSVGGGKRILKRSVKADNRADAERQMKAAIALANHGIDSATVTIVGRPALVSAMCIEVHLPGELAGKYFIDEIVNNIGKGYTMNLTLSKVE